MEILWVPGEVPAHPVYSVLSACATSPHCCHCVWRHDWLSLCLGVPFPYGPLGRGCSQCLETCHCCLEALFGVQLMCYWHPIMVKCVWGWIVDVQSPPGHISGVWTYYNSVDCGNAATKACDVSELTISLVFLQALFGALRALFLGEGEAMLCVWNQWLP